MNERLFGSIYYEILNAINDKIDIDVTIAGKNANLSDDQIRNVIIAAKDAVNNIGGSAFKTLYKSVK